MPYPTTYLLANVCLVADIRILEEPFVVIQAASGIHSGLLQAFGNLIQLLPQKPFRYKTDGSGNRCPTIP